MIMLEQLKNVIRAHPEIAMITDRGLEDERRHVVFIAQNLASRYPELVEFFNEFKGIKPKVEVPIEKVETEEPKPKRKTKKSSK